MTTEKIQLEADEQILMQVRKHWFIIACEFFAIIIAAVVPLVLFIGLSDILEKAFDVTSYIHVFIALYTAWLLIMWMALFNAWTNYYLDVWTITTKRLIAVDQRGFFSRTTASFRLERLQDIIVSVNGIIPTLLNYGAIEIQTASEESNFKAVGLPNPSGIKATILNSVDILTQNGSVTTQSGV